MARKMKDSGIEWIGEIPEDWEVSKISNVYKLRRTKVDDVQYPPLSVTKQGVVPQLEHVAKTNDTANRKLVKKGDFVINSRSDRRGSCGISNYEGSVSLINTVLEPTKNMHPNYYDWLFNTSLFADEFYKWGNGIVDDLWTTTWDEMKKITIPMPPFKEQEKISDYIDRNVNIIDKVNNNLTQEIQTLEDYKKSLITEAVTKGLDKNVEMKDSGIEWIGEIPKHWEIIKLKNVADTITKGISPNYVEEKLTPVVNQATFSKGYFDYDLKYCNDSIKSEGLLYKNDILLATTGGGVLGKTYYFQEDEEYLASADVAFIRISNPEQSKLVYYFLSTKYDLLNGIFAKGATNQTHLQIDMLANMYIALPNERELKGIIDYLDKIDETIEKSMGLKQKQLSILENYKKSLIYEYVTGKKEVSDA
ncbi:MAG: restriction endonuclease subunit S [Peptoniphilus sp.]|nr:restriction endonuclease subunit S [Peptoniphilus sp.]MDD7362839.1 restriction endonuclease subunit S [Bacillota bacterium]MDY6043969.1 restriction endonuclease subunit S [Peptoniphilus sp.]